MFHLNTITVFWSTMTLLLSLSQVTATSVPPRPHASHPSKNAYKHAHSLGKNYKFSPNSGWQNVNATDLGYKYTRDVVPPVDKRNKKHGTNVKTSVLSGTLGASVSHLIGAVWNNLKGVGNAETVKITWYTGHDLLNPSCWPQSNWAPTDSSFACALTLEGWTTRPKCFKFLEVCNGPKKCIFVRVVDTCAGCAPGSKHVDLTQGAFSQLADVNAGVLMVQMREATDPKEWFEDLWGPKEN